jgi:hypothetical protein
MPFTEGLLKKGYGLTELKNIFNAIAAHKSALPQYTDTEKPDQIKNQREKQIVSMKRKDLIFDNTAYKGVKQTFTGKRDYIISQILRIQDPNVKPMQGSLYESEGDIDYEQKFGNLHAENSPINRYSGYIGNKAPQGEASEKEEKPKEEKPKEEKPKEEKPKEVEKPKEAEKPKVEEEKEEFEVKPKPKKTFNTNKFASELGVETNATFDQLAEHFDELLEQLNELPAGQDEKYDELQKELGITLEGMTATRDSIKETQILRDKGLVLNKLIPNIISKAGAKTANVKDIKQGLKTLKEDKEMAKALKPSMQYVEDIEKLQATPETVYESKEKNVFVDQSNKGKTVGDQNIGNVRAIGIAPMTAPAREEEVIPPPSERAKSLRRFANFRWVYSNQNSDLGYDSPFQRIQDQEDKRRFGMCYLPTSKLPKPETQEDLNKVKSFNTYPLVPSQNLSGIMQPAGELSFKSSTNPNARKITIDEKQFANTKLYNFEPTQVNIKPNNPFSGMYGMQPLDQIKRNPDIQANTLEFSSVMYDDCPFERIKNKYRNKIVT